MDPQSGQVVVTDSAPPPRYLLYTGTAPVFRSLTPLHIVISQVSPFPANQVTIAEREFTMARNPMRHCGLTDSFPY